MENKKIFLAPFLTLLIFGILSKFLSQFLGLDILVGAFGASTAILFYSPNEKISSYRNLAIGYGISCSMGIGINYALSSNWFPLKIALSVSLAIFFMRKFNVFHPAGGAIALLSTTYQFKSLSELFIYLLGTSILGPSLFYLIVLFVRRINLWIPDEANIKN